MALETLKEIDQIDGFPVAHKIRSVWISPIYSEHDNYVKINHEENTILFKIQDKPIKEVGENGCQVDTLIATAILIIAGLNEKYPCKENEDALNGLQKAYDRLLDRKINREKRGVEGLSKE